MFTVFEGHVTNEELLGHEQVAAEVADIANGVKHLTRNRPPRLDAKMRLLVNDPASRIREIVVEIHVRPKKDERPVPRRVSAETIAGRCMAYWDELLRREKLL